MVTRKVQCQQCKSFVRSRYCHHGRILCYRCYDKEIIHIPANTIDWINTTIYFSLPFELMELANDRIASLDIKKSEYIRQLVLKDLEENLLSKSKLINFK